MRISHKHKFIFLSRPRCASTYLREILTPYSDIVSSSRPPFYHHATAYELEQYFVKKDWNWNDYLSFTTLRNPFYMMVSYYEYFKPDINGIYRYEKSRDGVQYDPDSLIDFNQWIQSGKTLHRAAVVNGKKVTNSWVPGFSRLTLNNTIIGRSGHSIVNQVLKVEDFSTTFEEFLSNMGIPVPEKLPDMNKSSRQSDINSYYTSKSRKIIEKEFESDIEIGKYKF